MLFTFAQYDTEVLIFLNIMQQMRDTAANWWGYVSMMDCSLWQRSSVGWDIYNGRIVRAGRPFCPQVIIATPSNRPASAPQSWLLAIDYSIP